jgi:hypothetical protein
MFIGEHTIQLAQYYNAVYLDKHVKWNERQNSMHAQSSLAGQVVFDFTQWNNVSCSRTRSLDRPY